MDERFRLLPPALLLPLLLADPPDEFRNAAEPPEVAAPDETIRPSKLPPPPSPLPTSPYEELSSVPSSDTLPLSSAFEVVFEVEILRLFPPPLPAIPPEPGQLPSPPLLRCSLSSCLRCCDCSIFANAFTIASILRSSRVSLRLGFSDVVFFSVRTPPPPPSPEPLGFLLLLA
uniref:Putative secreted protein n=1 Tax=Anopheles triannulatus TaxID=58253 RepID=A0A2M4B188_9DIPT